MAEQIKCFEQALRVWEDICFMQNIAWKYMKATGQPYQWNLEGAFVHWQEYRDHIMNLSPFDLSDYDFQRFLMPAEEARYYPILKNLPEGLARWTVSSRRVYDLSRELTALLTATSLKDMTWRDLSFPFDCFAITLERPIVDSSNNSFDCILVKKSDVAGMSLLMLATDHLQYQPTTDKRKERLQTLLRKKRWDELYDQLNKKAYLPSSSIIGLCVESLDEPIIDSLYRMFRSTTAQLVNGSIINENARPTEKEFSEVVTHIVAGFCLYLTTLPYGSNQRSEWVSVVSDEEKKRRPKAIVNTAEVCAVGSTIRLTNEQVELIESLGTQAKREVSSHFRQGHFRRPPGKGDDPEAKKTVHVSPAFVNRSTLKKGTLPVGAKTVTY